MNNIVEGILMENISKNVTQPEQIEIALICSKVASISTNFE